MFCKYFKLHARILRYHQKIVNLKLLICHATSVEIKRGKGSGKCIESISFS